jgi:hypothetical protein
MGRKVRRVTAGQTADLLDALRRDRVLSLRQISRHLGILQAQVLRLHEQGVVKARSFLLRRTGTSYAARWWKVAGLPSRSFPAQRFVAHYLGIAETRLVLQSRFSQWRTLREQRDEWKKWELFDAVAWDAGGRATLIEYDTGSHVWSGVLARVEAGRRLQVGQLWATPSPQRARTLAGLCPDIEVWLIDWLDGAAYCVGSPGRPFDEFVEDGSTASNLPSSPPRHPFSEASVDEDAEAVADDIAPPQC